MHYTYHPKFINSWIHFIDTWLEHGQLSAVSGWRRGKWQHEGTMCPRDRCSRPRGQAAAVNCPWSCWGYVGGGGRIKWEVLSHRQRCLRWAEGRRQEPSRPPWRGWGIATGRRSSALVSFGFTGCRGRRVVFFCLLGVTQEEILDSGGWKVAGQRKHDFFCLNWPTIKTKETWSYLFL